MKRALFAGLITMDCLYRVDHLPEPDEKLVAQEAFFAAGGPATNAAVAFQHLGGRSRLVTAVGNSFLSELVASEVQQIIAELTDLASEEDRSPSISSIFVLPSGARSVVSLNAKIEPLSADYYSPTLLEACDCLMVDGHHMDLCKALAAEARRRGIPVVADGGSWKAGSSELFATVDVAICSARFFPPDCRTPQDVISWLHDKGVQRVAITNGLNPIKASEGGHPFSFTPPRIDTVDTTGAGDIFHGAFCYYWSNPLNFCEALQRAANVAATKCCYFGTRSWMQHTLLQ
jgi:sugar/nucleoside kinase (ribokinase family)